LNIRQPVQITSLAYISPSPTSNHHHIITGTLLGDVRQYDTRAARRPIADWKGIGKVGGVKVVEKGLADQYAQTRAASMRAILIASSSEAFVADGGSNIFALDLRVGKVIYRYKGLHHPSHIRPFPGTLSF
jgi:ribosome biogenesis protein NSA1